MNHSAFVPNQGPVFVVADWRTGHEIIYCRRLIRSTIAKYLSTHNHMQLQRPSSYNPATMEYLLFETATSKEEYLKRETLYQRMQQIQPIMLSCGGSNLYLPQPQANTYDMGLINQRVGSGSINYNDENMSWTTGMELLMQSRTSSDLMMLPQLVSSNSLDTFYDFRTSTSSLGPQDIYQPQKLDSQNNVTHFGQSVGYKRKAPDQPQLATCLANNNVPFGNTETMPLPCAAKRGKMESGFGIPSIPSSSEQPPELTLKDIFERQFNIPLFPSECLKAGQISVQPDPKSYGMIDSSNLMGTDFGSNSGMHTLSMDPIHIDVDDMKGRTGINQAETNATMKVCEEKANQDKQIKSEDARVNIEVERNAADDQHQLGTTFCNPILVSGSEVSEAGQTSVEPDPKSYDMIESSNFGLNSSRPTLKNDTIATYVDDIEDRTEFNEPGTNVIEKVSEPEADQEKQTKSSNAIVNEIERNVLVEAFAHSEIIPFKGPDTGQISEDPDSENHVVTDSSNLMEIDIGSNSIMHNLKMDPILTDIEDMQGRTAIEEAIEPKDDQEKQTKSSNATLNVVSLTELFTSDQIKQHIMSLRKQSGQSATEDEPEISANACQLCAKEKLFFAQSPIYCLGCGNRIKRNSNYFYRKEQEFDAYCSECFKGSKGSCITFTNGISIPKTLLEKKKNDQVLEEPWVECNKCKRWQHQVCALYNSKRDLDFSVEYICPVCCLKEIENGMRVPSPETAIFHAKDLPRSTLSDHLEKRLFKRLIEEKKSYAMKNNLVEVLTAENLSVREVLSVDKILNVEKQFLDILPKKKTYPAEFPYRSRVILLFQQIEGADVCIFAMYVQEYGSECGYPNRRCVYVSYLDSVKYLRPQRGTAVKNEALRTFIYHEILIGYLDFVKKRGFATCFIWACPPKKGEDYILYCHPTTQKTPRNDHLRQWYHSMLMKAAEENIVVGLTNVHDHLFVPTGKWDSKVTASQLPYFDGDCWSREAVNLVTNIGKESGGDYAKPFKKLPKRSLKDMGHHVNPPKSFVKDILVMQKLGQLILPDKEEFMVAHLQYSCMHCHEVIVSGKKRWFCTECNKIQECERCHTSGGVHTAAKGVEHRLSEVVVEDVPLSTEKNNITIYNGLFEDRTHFLDFCQSNQLQFDTLRHAKYSSMMILYDLKNLSPSEHPESKKNTLVERDKTLTHP